MTRKHKTGIKIVMIRKTVVLLIIILFAANAAYARPKLDETVKSFFPKPAALTGGEERWLGTDIMESKTDNGFSFNTLYSYYSSTEQSIMNIKRKKTFDVKAVIYAFNNYISAYDKYDELLKKAPKGKVQEISFGDSGVFYYIPKSAYINDADFTVLFINKIFIAEITADDGFALMDAAANINANIQRFVSTNIEFFLVRNISMSVSADGFLRSSDVLGFTDEEPSEVTVSGRVFTDEMKPLAGVEVRFLETGKAVKTDKEGNYSYSVKMGGKTKVALNKNFYLKHTDFEKQAKPLIEDGVFDVTVLKADGSLDLPNVWKLGFYGKSVYGSVLVDNDKIYPIKGNFDNGSLSLTMDCHAPSSAFKCVRRFEGTIDNGTVKGSWTGTGGGGKWQLALGSYAEMTDYVYLNNQNADFKRLSFKNGVSTPEKGELTTGVTTNSITGIFFSLKKDSPEFNSIFIKNASLVLTHLPVKQTGRLRLFRYITDTKNERIVPAENTMTYAGDAAVKKEIYEISADVSDYLFSSARSGVLIAPMLKGKNAAASHTFAGTDANPAAYAPKLKVVRYVPAHSAVDNTPFTIRLKTLKGEDRVGRRNAVRADGEADTVFEAVIKMPGKTITFMEIYSETETSERRNTDPLDIYPVIGFIKKGDAVNDQRGDVKYLLSEPVEKFDLHITPFNKTAVDDLKYKIIISGEVFEGSIGK